MIFSNYMIRNSSSVLQILLVRDELPSRGQLPEWSLYKGQRKAFSFARKSLPSPKNSPLRYKPDCNRVDQTFVPVGLRTSSKEWHGTEEAGQTSQHHFARPPLLCRSQSDFSDMVSWNWKSETRNVHLPVELLKAFVCEPTAGLWLGSSWPSWSCLSDLLPVRLPGEAADVPSPPAEAEDEGHPKPRSLQSAE